MEEKVFQQWLYTNQQGDNFVTIQFWYLSISIHLISKLNHLESEFEQKILWKLEDLRA